MKRRLLLLLILTAAMMFTGCETVDKSNYAESVTKVAGEDEGKTKTGLVISGDEADSISTEYFGTVEFVFRNTTDEWIRVKNLKISFGDENIDKNVLVPVGQDLYEWQKAFTKQLAIDYRNKSRFLATAAFISGAVTAATSDSKEANRAAAVFGTAVAAMAINDINSAAKMENMAATAYPEDHLLGGNFAVPPGLFANKFIVLNSRKNSEIGYLSKIIIEYETESGIKDKVVLQFRKNPYQTGDYSSTGSKWQESVLKERYRKITEEEVKQIVNQKVNQ